MFDFAAIRRYYFSKSRKGEEVMDRPYAKIIVNEKAERSLRQGHPWVYGAEVIEREG